MTLLKTINLLILGSLCLIGVAALVGRIMIWTCLGPGLKLLDIVLVHQYYKTDEQLLDDIVHNRVDQDYWFLPFFDSIIEHEVFQSMKQSGRIVAEDALKLKDMQENLHGVWSERVSWTDNSHQTSVPLSQSSAYPWEASDEPQLDTVEWRFAPGRKLEGDMILRCHGCSSSICCNSTETARDKKKIPVRVPKRKIVGLQLNANESEMKERQVIIGPIDSNRFHSNR